MKTINWYPGHMKKTRELIEEHLKLVDVVLEICDARIPVSSRNPILAEITKGKPRVIILNKNDLADESATKDWIRFLCKAEESEKILTVAEINALSGKGVKELLRILEKTSADPEAVSGKTGIPLRLMVIGVPNSGKSSLINRLTGRRAAQVGDRPGVTRGKQWLTLKNGMQLLDTPGILWPKFEDQKVGLHLAFCGSIRDEIMDTTELGMELIRLLFHKYPDSLKQRYGIDESELEIDMDEALAVMEGIAKNRGFILQGARIDYERTARTVLDEFRSGKLGRITLEFCQLTAE